MPCSDKFKFPFFAAQRDEKLCPPPGVQFTVTYMKKSKNSPPCQQFFFQFPRQRYPIMPNRRSFILHSSLHSSPQLCLLTFRPAGRADVPMCRTHITFKNTKLTWSQSFQDVCVCVCACVVVCVFTNLHMSYHLFQVIKIISADVFNWSVITEVFLDKDRLCVCVCSCVAEVLFIPYVFMNT